MEHLSLEDFHRCNESLELDDVYNSLADILHDTSWRIEEDSFCELSCMLRIEIRTTECDSRNISTWFYHNKEQVRTCVKGKSTDKKVGRPISVIFLILKR